MAAFARLRPMVYFGVAHTPISTELICALLTNAHNKILLLISDAHCIGRTGTSARSNTTPKRELAEEVDRAPSQQVTVSLDRSRYVGLLYSSYLYTSIDSDVLKGLVLQPFSTRGIPRSIPMFSIHDVCRISLWYPDFRRGTGSFLSAFLRRLGMAAGALSCLCWPSVTGLNGCLLSPDTFGYDVLF